MSNQIKGTHLEKLFDRIRGIYTDHGFDLFTPWQSWSTLNEFYPCHLTDGDYLITDEHNKL